MADGRLEKIGGGWQSRLTTNSTWERFSRVRKVRRVREILHLLLNENKPTSSWIGEMRKSLQTAISQNMPVQGWVQARPNEE
jgi:hypothetical protein